MTETKKKGFGWGYLIIGILFIFTSMVAFYDPARNLRAFVFVFAGMAIVQGFWLIVDNNKSVLRIIAGILNILIGGFMIFNVYIAIATLPFIFSIWFISDSILRILALREIKDLGKGYYIFLLIMNLIGVAVGVMLFFRPILALLTLSFMVGFYLMIIGIDFIILAFSQHQK